PAPIQRHTKHLDRKSLDKAIAILINLVTNHRRKVYVTVVMVLLVAAYGISKVTATGNIVDDLPDDDQIRVDLKFFEENFKGVMPLDILIGTKGKGDVTNDKTLRTIEELQIELATYPEISKSLSIVDAVKFAKQAYYNGVESKFALLNNYEKSFIGPYIQGNKDGTGDISKLFLDSTKQYTRITAQIADIGTEELDSLMTHLAPKVDSIFPPADYSTILSGTCIVFLDGTNYLVQNLFTSLAFAIVLIAALMALLFGSFLLIFVSMAPNLIPPLC